MIMQKIKDVSWKKAQTNSISINVMRVTLQNLRYLIILLTFDDSEDNNSN